MSAKTGLMTRNEAAAYLRMSPSWMRQSPGAPQAVKLGRKPYSLQADLDLFLEKKLPWQSTSVALRRPGTSSSRPKESVNRGSTGTAVRAEDSAYERRARVTADSAPSKALTSKTLAHGAALDVNRATAKGLVPGALSALQGHWKNLSVFFDAGVGPCDLTAARVTFLRAPSP